MTRKIIYFLVGVFVSLIMIFALWKIQVLGISLHKVPPVLIAVFFPGAGIRMALETSGFIVCAEQSPCHGIYTVYLNCFMLGVVFVLLGIWYEKKYLKKKGLD